jgi:hypothetical protein
MDAYERKHGLYTGPADPAHQTDASAAGAQGSTAPTTQPPAEAAAAAVERTERVQGLASGNVEGAGCSKAAQHACSLVAPNPLEDAEQVHLMAGLEKIIEVFRERSSRYDKQDPEKQRQMAARSAAIAAQVRAQTVRFKGITWCHVTRCVPVCCAGPAAPDGGTL